MKIKRKIIIPILGIIGAVSFAVVGESVLPTLNTATAQEVTLSWNNLETEYCIGDSFTIADTMEMKVGEETIVGKNPRFVTPTGKTYGSGEYVFSEAGEYTISYFGMYEGKTVSASQEVNAYSYAWSFSENSNANYEQLTRYSVSEAPMGINLDLAGDDAFVFQKRLDISNLEQIDICKIFPAIRDYKEQEGIVSTVTVKIVDAYNPDIFMEVYVWLAPRTIFYCGAGAYNQKLGGFESQKDTGKTLYQGLKWNFHQSDRYQATTVYGKYCCYGATTQAFVEEGGMSFALDLKNYKVLLTNKNGATNNLVNDLASPELHGENIFTGFPSNEVYAVIQCYNYKASSINIQVESLLGFKGEELANTPMVDNEKPIVSLNAEKTNSAGVYVVKGQEYTIPADVFVRDLNYYDDLSVNVYYNYGTVEQTLVYAKGGKFTPTQNGRYTVEYKATDAYGNVGIETLDLMVVDGQEGITYTEQKINKLVLAQENVFPNISAQGVNKTVTSSVVVVNPKGEETQLDNELSYVPVYKGEYTVIYTFKDNVYTRTYSYKITATDENAILQKSTPKLPAYFLKNAEYMFEEYEVEIVGDSGLQSVKTDISLSIDNDEYQAVDTAKVYKIDGTNLVKVKYTYQGKEVRVEERKIIDVGYETNNRQYISYFQGDYINAETDDAGFKYTFDGDFSTQSMTYANLVSLMNFNFGFSIPNEKDNFQKISIIITDYSNAKNQIIIAYEKVDDQVNYTLTQLENGKAVVDNCVEGLGIMAATRTITYSAETLTDESGNSVKIIPFENDLAIVSVKIEGMSQGTEAVVEIREVNNQKMGKYYYEQAPLLTYETVERGYQLGETYTIRPAKLTHIANIALPTCVKLSVYLNGETIIDDSGLNLYEVSANEEYTITFAESGNYVIFYTYFCISNSATGTLTGSTSVPLTVVDTQAPKITFDGVDENKVVKMSVGHTHTIRAYTITDNDTATEDLMYVVSVFDESGTTIVSFAEKVTFTKKGKYTVRVWAVDKDGNIGIAYYSILVE